MSQVVFNTNLEAELLGEYVPKPDSFLHVKSQCLEGEVVATRNGVYSASTEIQDLRRLTKKAAELGNEEQRLPACLHSNRNFIPLTCYKNSKLRAFSVF